MMRDYAHAKLDEYTTNDIYFVSSLQALEGKKELNAEKYKPPAWGRSRPSFRASSLRKRARPS